MHFSRLALRNFRGFKDTTLELDPHLTVLVGPNGSGKTSLLRALDLMASRLASLRMKPANPIGAKPDELDVGMGASSALLVADWEDPKASLKLKISRGEAREISVDATPSGASQAPVWFYYGSTHRSRLRADVSPDMGTHGRLSAEFTGEYAAWSDENNRGFLPFERLWGWYKKREDDENAERVRLRNLDYNDPALQFVRQSVERLLGEPFRELRVSRDRLYSMTIKKGDSELAIEQLSDGERSLLVLAASIARRLALFSTESSSPVDQAGTVLIDEVEQHLHGKWQRQVLPRLRQAFPNVQFVVTTHSPIVLSGARDVQVRVLDNYEIYAGPERIYGRDPNALFEDVFGVPRRPYEVAERLNAVGDLIDSGAMTAAKVELDRLASELGEQDTEIVRLRVLASFLDAEADSARRARDGGQSRGEDS